MVPRYLVELCRPVSNIDAHQHLQSADCGQLDFPESGCQYTEDARAVLPDLQLGTLFLML